MYGQTHALHAGALCIAANTFASSLAISGSFASSEALATSMQAAPREQHIMYMFWQIASTASPTQSLCRRLAKHSSFRVLKMQPCTGQPLAGEAFQAEAALIVQAATDTSAKTAAFVLCAPACVVTNAWIRACSRPACIWRSGMAPGTWHRCFQAAGSCQPSMTGSRQHAQLSARLSEA